MKKAEIIEKESKFLVLRNCVISDDKVIAFGGKAYTTGEFGSDPQSNKIHEIRCEVIADYGVDTSEDVVVILDAEWAKEIDNEIIEKLKQ